MSSLSSSSEATCTSASVTDIRSVKSISSGRARGRACSRERHASRRSARLVGCGSSSSQRKCRPSRPSAASRSRSPGLARRAPPARRRRRGRDARLRRHRSRRRDVVARSPCPIGSARRRCGSGRIPRSVGSTSCRCRGWHGRIPYLQPSGHGWPDNHDRFFRFAAAVAAYVARRPARRVAPQRLAHRHGARRTRRSAAERAVDPQPRVSGDDRRIVVDPSRSAFVALRMVGRHEPAVGWRSPSPTGWSRCRRTTPGRSRHGRAGSVSTDRCGPAARRSSGILNGIDTDLWNPATDPLLESTFDIDSLDGRAANRDRVAATVRLARSTTSRSPPW